MSSTPEPGRPSQHALRTAVRAVSQTLITVGLVALLFVVHQLWVTDLLAGRAQDRLAAEIESRWAELPTVAAPDPPAAGGAVAAAGPGGAAPAPEGAAAAPEGPASDHAAAPAHVPAAVDVAIGEPFAVLRIPRLGTGYARVVVEGASEAELAQGPGHYRGTAMPGEPGNFAVAGHRVGRGSPFLDLDRLRPGDPVVVETGDSWFVYRVLGDAATGDFAGDPSGIPGREIVRPRQVSVIAPTPGGGAATDAYLTLTTCHPRYSAAQRLVVHARLDGAPISKAAAPDGPPALAG